MIESKRANLLNQVVIQIILVGIIFAIFFMGVAGQVNGRDVKQQVLEKQTALLIDAADVGMSFDILKVNINGLISKVEVRDGRIFIAVDGFPSFSGYPYFSRYSVSVEEESDRFRVVVR
jgi:hypothetical protein